MPRRALLALVTLLSRSRLKRSSTVWRRFEELVENTRSDRGLPMWKIALERTDPLYHAFERHEIMGDPRTFVYPPEVTADDIAHAEAFKKRSGAARAGQTA
jgi:hypothetical protein